MENRGNEAPVQSQPRTQSLTDLPKTGEPPSAPPSAPHTAPQSAPPVLPATSGQGFGAAATPRPARATLQDRQQRLVRQTLEAHGWVEGTDWAFEDGEVVAHHPELIAFLQRRTKGIPQGPGAPAAGV
jgi:hypothetical protein